MEKLKKIHFIAVGESSMAELAIALKLNGHDITGSDEEINTGIKAKLLTNNLVPQKIGWSPELIQPGMDSIIIGTSVSADNPELKKAQEFKLPIYSFADFIYELSKDKHRLVVAGSHGKTTIMLIILHVLNFHKRKFDHVLTGGASIKEPNLIKLSTAPLIVIEGQDVMTRAIDGKPAFLKYHHHIGVISGIEWQRSDAYPTQEEYARQFGLFGAATPKGGILIYFELNPVVAVLSTVNQPDVTMVPYKTYVSDNDGSHEYLITSEKKRVPLKITGKHNLQSISAAKEALKKIGITSEMFYQAIPTFESAIH
ncbi:MAG: hypothetical protein HOP08_16160 [Cyclobacteriaceae bacterium]|nr:hypothetical protein [Cyclobacteriaceae bacterium]